MKDDLRDLPNIGNTMAASLEAVGITTPGELRAAGSRKAFLLLHTLDQDACLSKLSALEGAIQGIRWHNLDPATKAELAEFHSRVKDGGKLF